MRVCYLTPGTGMGYYHYAINLLQGVQAADEDVAVDVFYIADGDDDDFPGAASTHPLAYAGADSFPVNVAVTLYYQFRLLVYLLVRRPHVAHLNTFLFNQYYTLALTLAFRLALTPVVRTVHEETGERLRDVSALSKRLARVHLAVADHLIVHTDAVASSLSRRGVSTPTTVLPHGNYLFFRKYVDDETPPPLPTHGRPVVLFFGVKSYKGIGLFVEALARLDPESCTVWVVGPVTPGDEHFLDRLGAFENVHTDVGYLPDEKLAAYFQHADIVPMPYSGGTTSGALHLALSFETAVVVSDLPCFTEVVDDGRNGWVLSAYTAAALADAIDGLVTDRDRRRALAAAGLATERSPEYDWERIGRATVDVYCSV